MTIVSRLQIDHPALGAAGGAGLHANIEAIYTKIGNNISTRILVALNLNASATATVTHNFKTALANLRYDLYLYDEITTALTRITATSSPALSAFTIIANVGAPTTDIDITNNSGVQRDLALVVYADAINLSEGDIKDVDVTTTAPQEGQALVYDSVSATWKPGASGDASFKVQSVTTPNAVIKGGYIGLDDGRELATYDGSGSLSTDFGTDQTVSLTTIFGSTPANATTYHLYIDLETLSAAVTTTDTGRKLSPVVLANYILSTTTPDAMNRGRYVHVGFVRSATTGNAWSGTGAAFGTFATRKHDNGPIAISPVAYRLTQQAVGAVGSAGQVVAGHVLTAKSWPTGTTTARRYYNLAANALDSSGNGDDLTNNGTTPFTGTSILGATNAAANLNGTTQSFSSTDADLKQSVASLAMGIWCALADWTPAANQAIISTEFDTTNRGPTIRVIPGGQVEFYMTTDGTAANFVTIFVPNPGFVDGSWHNFAMVYDHAAGVMKAYIDGKCVGTNFLTVTAVAASHTFRVGARGTAASDFITGRVQEAFFLKAFTLTDEDVRKLYSFRVDHTKAVAAVNQAWEASIAGNCMTQDAYGWLVCKNDPDSVFWDFGDLASTDLVSIVMQDTGLSAAVVQARQPFDVTYASGTAANAAIGAGLAHGQGEVPLIYLQREVNTGEWETMDPTGKIRADASSLITEDLTVITERVRVRAVGGVLPTAAGTATSSTAGLVKAYSADPTLARLAASGDVTLTASDGYSLVAMTTGASDRTITLPAAASASGREITAKKIDSGAGKMIVDANGAETIDGATTTEITTQWAAVRVRSNGTSWEITG